MFTYAYTLTEGVAPVFPVPMLMQMMHRARCAADRLRADECGGCRERPLVRPGHLATAAPASFVKEASITMRTTTLNQNDEAVQATVGNVAIPRRRMQNGEQASRVKP
jgi:hypothetical protein